MPLLIEWFFCILNTKFNVFEIQVNMYFNYKNNCILNTVVDTMKWHYYLTFERRITHDTDWKNQKNDRFTYC